MASKLEALKKKKAAGVATPKIATREEIKRTELAMTTVAQGEEYHELDVDAIQLNPANDYRMLDTEQDIAELADDIERNGLLHNLVVSARSDGNHILLSGERRLRALKMLKNDPKRNGNGKFNRILVKFVYGLDELDEMIYLDSANLQTRGSLGDDVVCRNVVKRYVENLQKKYDISQEAAQAILKKTATGMSDRTIYRVLQINNDLIPALTEMLDQKSISRHNAIDYCQCNEEMQQYICELILACKKYADENPEKNAVAFINLKNELGTACAGPDDEVKKAALKKIADEFICAVSTQDEKQPAEESDAIPAIQRKRTKYIDKYSKMAKEIRGVTTARKVKSMLALEAAGGEGSILESLDELAAAIDDLRNKLRG